MDKQQAILLIKDHMAHHGIGEYPHIFLGEALNMAIDALSPPNEHLTCDGCISLGTSYGPCMNCVRSRLRGDMYRRPPEGEEEI